MNKLTESELAFIISRVLGNAYSVAEDSKSEKSDDFINGQKLAYYEILDTIRNELDVRDIDLKQYGLNIDLESLI